MLPELAVTPLSSPEPGGIAVVSVWGVGAGDFMRRIFPGLSRRQVVYKRLKDGESVVDETVAVLFPPGDSLTGTEEGEISFHGGPMARRNVLRFLEKLGAAVLPGEKYLEEAACFDAVQSEAWSALRFAVTERQTGFLLRQLRGELSSAVDGIVTRLRRRSETGERSGEGSVWKELDSMLQRSAAGISLVRGIRVLVAGPPNAGKSTLINRLCGTDRAIVTPVAGTTRDILEAGSEIEGFPVTFVDSAGLSGSDKPWDRFGRERLREELETAGVVLGLGCTAGSMEVEPRAFIPLGPKADLGGSYEGGVLPVSGLTGLGISKLRRAVLEAAACGGDLSKPCPFTERQAELLREAREACSGCSVQEVIGFLKRVGSVAPGKLESSRRQKEA